MLKGAEYFMRGVFYTYAKILGLKDYPPAGYELYRANKPCFLR